MAGLLEGKVAVVTGAGGGNGREHALALAREGARIVVNDLGSDRHGGGNRAGQRATADHVRHGERCDGQHLPFWQHQQADTGYGRLW